ncbi:unnamed protein product [Effrenium voratum]|nr:unnamed protein product [Effrenium voratum]
MVAETMRLGGSKDDHTRTQLIKHNTKRTPRLAKSRMERVLLRLRAGLQRLGCEERRKALEQLPHPAREALLRFMTKDHFALPSEIPEKHAGKGRSRPGGSLRKEIHKGVAEKVEKARHPGIRQVPVGLFQASISIQNLLVRSRTSRSLEFAARLHGVLQRFRELARSGESWMDAAELARAQAEACHEAGLTEDELRPSYSVSLSTCWAGKVESPTTSSLQKAVVWRQRLLAARDSSWKQFRAAWVALLQEERPGGSVAMKQFLAEARVDHAVLRRLGHRPKVRRSKKTRASAPANYG